jgi:signal transduction histidine kinase
MTAKSTPLSVRYRLALDRHLKSRGPDGVARSGALGRRALASGLATLDVARMHREALADLTATDGHPLVRDPMVQRAQAFFIEAITPIEHVHGVSMRATVQLEQREQALRQRTGELATANRQLSREIQRRQAAEESLKKSEQHYQKLLEQSRLMHEQLRRLSRQVLQAQEEERKEISRELHDDIAQTLTGINVHLEALSQESTANTRGLRRKINRTQRLVTKSVNIVHRFARELRPTLLDDLGLVPALHSLLKEYSKRTGLRARLTAFVGIEQLSNLKRTVLYRVVQAALTNVAQHAQATLVKVNLRKVAEGLALEVTDNGKGFEVERVLFARGRKGLGLLGMRERVEMVGGRFTVDSAPRGGTTLRAEIPFRNGGRP